MFAGRLLLAVAVSVPLAMACAQRSANSPPSQEPTASAQPSNSRGAVLPGGVVNAWEPKSCKLSTVYFGFDSATLDQVARDALIDGVTCYMNTALPQLLLVTGATDPRGTEEYNLALGQKRAGAVSKLLITLGIPAQRVLTTSLGEERASGTDEAGYRLDRFASTLEQ